MVCRLVDTSYLFLRRDRRTIVVREMESLTVSFMFSDRLCGGGERREKSVRHAKMKRILTPQKVQIMMMECVSVQAPASGYKVCCVQ